MKGVPQRSQHRIRSALGPRESIQGGCHGTEVVLAEIPERGLAELLELEPELMEPHALQIQAVTAERMNVAASLPIPVHELDAELERALGTDGQNRSHPGRAGY